MVVTDTHHNPSSRPAPSWDSCGITHVGKARLHNEDAFLERPDIGLWAVADGMGGHTAGAVASRMIVDTLDEITAQLSLSRFVHEVKYKLQTVNQRLLQMAAEDLQRPIIGSTVVTLLLHNSTAVFLWAGDSRLYRYRAGRLQQLSTDHSEVQAYIEEGLISSDEATHHPFSNLITRAVGAIDRLNLDLGRCRLQVGDRFLLCTDGLTRYLDPAEMEQHFSRGSATECCNGLIEASLAYPATDNITAVVIDIF